MHLINYRYGADKLLKGPRVLLDRNAVENYFREDSEEEKQKKREAERIRRNKKAAYYNRMKNKNWKAQSQSPNKFARDQLYKNRSSRKIDSRRLLSREYDFPEIFSHTENQFSGKTYFYTNSPAVLHLRLWKGCWAARGEL